MVPSSNALSWIVLDLARNSIARHRLADAEKLVRGLLLSRPVDSAAWSMLASVELRSGRPGDALASARIAEGIDARNHDAPLLAAEASLALKDRNAAVAALSRAAAGESPASARARSLLKALGA